jgi:hypothetical protein
MSSFFSLFETRMIDLIGLFSNSPNVLYFLLVINVRLSIVIRFVVYFYQFYTPQNIACPRNGLPFIVQRLDKFCQAV